MLTHPRKALRGNLKGISSEIEPKKTSAKVNKEIRGGNQMSGKRYSTNTAKDHKIFKHTATTTKKLNVKNTMMRGGIRL